MNEPRFIPNGHNWQLGEYGDIDIWAYDGAGKYCNGPRCLDCGLSACHHCNPGIYDKTCNVKGKP